MLRLTAAIAGRFARDALAPGEGEVCARFQRSVYLVLPGGKTMGGLYTVILKRLPEGWRIVHDHSSAE